MRIKLTSIIVAAIAMALLAEPRLFAVAPVGTAFTYQGQLKQGGNAVNSTADFEFRLFDDAAAGSAIGPVVPLNGVSISEGFFTVDLDFGSAVSWSEARWLEIAVRSPAGSGSFTTLSPRQQLRPTPVAQFALNVDGAGITNLNASNISSGTLPSSALSGTYSGAVNFSNAGNTFNGNGAGLTSLNATNLSAGTLPTARLAGTYSSALTFNNAANSFIGNGAGLTNLNANNITTGNLNSARMPTGGAWSLSNILDIGPGAMYIVPGVPLVGIGTTNPSWPLHIVSNQLTSIRVDSTNAGAGQFIGGYFSVAGTGARGVFGTASSPTGTTYGVHGRTESSSGRGVLGEALASTGINFGVYGVTNSTSGRGVFGEATADTGTTFGFYGTVDSTSGRAVYGEAVATTGSTYGGMFHSTSTSGTGVFGFASATTGTTNGGWFATSSTSGRGIYSEATATSGAAYGVHAETNSGSGAGVRAINNAASGLGYAVYATTDSSAGFAVRGVASTTTGSGTGVYGISNGPTGTGVWGVATGADAWGGRFSGGVRVSGDYYGTGHLWLHAYEGDNTSGTAFIQARDTSTTSNVNLRLRTKSGTAINDVMTLTSASQVGIGTTAPNSALHVNGGPGVNPLRVQNSGLTKLLVHDNGNVMIGASSTPVTPLHVDGGSDVEPGSGGYLILGATNSTNLAFDNNEIMCRNPANPGSNATLFLNNDGGDVSVSAGGSGKLITRVIQITGGSDLSEQFNVSDAHIAPQPGMVVVIDPRNPGRLMPATIAYDKKVAGIISGAGGVQTGMMMGQNGSIADGKHPVALTGRVYCLVDAAIAAIEPGDMLTTSSTPGHAMKAEDAARSHGTIIGKAMTALARGEKGLVLVLVNLQ